MPNINENTGAAPDTPSSIDSAYVDRALAPDYSHPLSCSFSELPAPERAAVLREVTQMLSTEPAGTVDIEVTQNPFGTEAVTTAIDGRTITATFQRDNDGYWWADLGIPLTSAGSTIPQQTQSSPPPDRMENCCDVCGHEITSDTSAAVVSDSGMQVCSACATARNIGTCRMCGALAEGLQEGLCPECVRELSRSAETEEMFTVSPRSGSRYSEDRSVIHEYHYDTSFTFHHLPNEDMALNPYMGFELEVDAPSGSNVDQNAVAELVTEPGICFCKHDGSLCSGFEMVSHPMTLNTHKATAWPFKLRTIAREGMVSYDCRTCSMHVHVNRDFLSYTRWIQLDDWVSEHKDFVVKIARRHSRDYARFHSDISDSTLQEARRGAYRYVAVNFANPSTIEFRIFRGTLKPCSLMKNLEFVDALVRFFKCELDHSLENFRKFVEKQPRRYAEFLAYMQERNIWAVEGSEHAAQ